MRFKCFLLLTGLGLIIGPAAGLDPLRGAPGGGGEHRAAGRDSTDLKARWKQLAGSAAVWRRADLTDPQQQFIFDLVADRLQCASGEITRDQFLGMTRRPTAKRSDGAASHGGSGQPKAAKRPAPSSATPSPARRPDSEDDSRPAPSAEAEFRKLDANGDGLLNYDEMDDALRAERDRWDTNQDGFIDLAEFKAYFKARTRHERPAKRRTVVARKTARAAMAPDAADLPPNLPDWFRQYDTDGDGQVGLYEWKAAGQPIARFLAMDSNADGFLTPDEVLGPTPVNGETKKDKDSPKKDKDSPKKDNGSPRNESAIRLFQSLGSHGMIIRLGN